MKTKLWTSIAESQFSSVQSLSFVSNSLQPHELQHARPPCPLQTPGVYSNSCPSSQWCHPAISSSVIPFSSCPQSLPASGSFQWVNSLNEVAKVLEFQLQHQSLQWTPRTNLLQDGLGGSPCSPRDSQESSPTPQFKASIFRRSAFFIVQLPHPYMITGKTIALTRGTFVGKVISLLFNMLSRLAITFLPRNKRLLISWLQSPSAVILEPQKIKSDTVWDEYNCAVVSAFFGIAFLWDWNENWPFPVLWPLLSFPNVLAYWVQHFRSISF